ncbi:hypothetical protein GCM10022222_01150 [Amycolatopsis ultiminotia]|uniref:Uncharacterized protein n=1 Tax=Amycolatopsis ultiminotia TaxID=543629 RepID=A0ABP6UYB3_9PSEU
MRHVAVEFARVVEQAMLMRQVRASTHLDNPVGELQGTTDAYAVIVDRVVVMHRQEQVPIQPVDARRVRDQARQDLLSIFQRTDFPPEPTLVRADLHLVNPGPTANRLGYHIGTNDCSHLAQRRSGPTATADRP